MEFRVGGIKFQHRKQFTINIASVDLKNYQLKKTISFLHGMQTDMCDIRFTTLGGFAISYWNESVTNGVSSETWLKIPNISSDGTTKIWMYYGNSSAVSGSSGVDVFDLYHNFENTLDGYDAGTASTTQSFDGSYSLLPSEGSYSSQANFGIARTHIYEYRYYIPSSQSGDLYDASYSPDGVGSIDINYGFPTALKWGYRGDGGWVDSGIAVAYDEWQRFKIVAHSDDTYDLYSNGDTIVLGIGSSTITTVRHFRYSGKTIYIDSEIIRQYTAIEPTWAADGEAMPSPEHTQLIDARLVIQKPTGTKNLYYPAVVSASTVKTFGWTCPQCNIEIVTNTGTGTSGFTSPIRIHDIVRLQVSTRVDESDATIWRDVFEGRVAVQSSEFTTNGNNTIIPCKGHDETYLYRAITADYSASSTRTGAILQALLGLHVSTITDDTPSQIDTTASSVLSEYNIKEDTKYMADIVKDLQKLEGWGYILKAVTEYDSDNKLSAVYASWQPINPVASTKVQAIEGTRGFIESSGFDVSSQKLVNDVTQYGASGAPQKVGTASDATSQTAYDTRHHVGVDTTLATDALCGDFATIVKDKFKDPIIRGSVTIQGTPNVNEGDLIYTKIPSLELDGASIDGNFRVLRVSHRIDAGGWDTTLDLGDPINSPVDLQSAFHIANRLTSANFIG